MRARRLILTLLACMLAVSANAETYVFPSAGVKYTSTDGEEPLDGLRRRPGELFAAQTDGGARLSLSIYDGAGIPSNPEGMSNEQRDAFAKAYAEPFYQSNKWTTPDTLSAKATYLDTLGTPSLRLTDFVLRDGSIYIMTADAALAFGESKLRDALSTMKESVTYLNERVEAAAVSPSSGIQDGSHALIISRAGTLAVEADDLPGWAETQSLRFSVATEPGANVLASVDGEAQAFGQADASGRCGFTLRLNGSEGAHTIELLASLDGRAGKVVYELPLAVSTTPVLLRVNEAAVSTGSFDLYVYSIPGASIELETPFSTMRGRANTEGYVYFSLSIRRGAENTYIAKASLDGRKASEASVTLRRGDGAGEQAADFRSYAQTIPYKRLLDNPAAYANRRIEIRGRVERVGESNGFPTLVLNTSNRRSGVWDDPVYIVCHSLLNFQVGDVMTVLGTTLAQTYRYNGNGIPVIDGAFYLR